RRLVNAHEDVRSDATGAAADLAARMAAAWPGDLPEVRAGGTLRDRRVLDVAHGDQHDARRARDPAGLLERRTRAASVEDDDLHEDHRAGDAALHVHRVS